MKLTKIKEVQEWAEKRGLYESGDSLTQHCKFVEELGELAGAIIKNNQEKKIDAIGDCIVVLINLCKIKDIDFEALIPHANQLEIDFGFFHAKLSEKKNLRLILKTCSDFDKDGYEEQAICSAIVNLNEIAKRIGMTLEACLDFAYDEIKNRTGEMKNGSFIKDEE